MKISQYKKLNNDAALKKAHKKCKLWKHKEIRMRDIKWSESKKEHYFICIACGTYFPISLYQDKSIYDGRNLQVSHFFNADKYASVKYHDDNLNLSCERCNSPRGLHGNKEAYQPNLVLKIGQERFDELQRLAHKTHNFDILELERITDEAKLKAKLRANELQIKI
jgi:5-methylcytosine-specific restriction endonuclease McrA